MLVPEVGMLVSYKGAKRGCTSASYSFSTTILGKTYYLGSYRTETADTGARLYDSLQLLVYGPRADTNFEWSAYTQADIAAAAQFLHQKGVDVKEAVFRALEARGPDEWIGVGMQDTLWLARMSVHVKRKKVIQLCWSGLPSAAAAAQQADCGLLAVKGLRCTTNFPASLYSQLQLEEAGEHASSKGVNGTVVQANLAAVEKVRAPCVL
jgi:hypothetical protein